MKIQIHTDFNQHSQEWYAIRRTHIGSSKNPMAVKGKKHPSGLGVAAVEQSYKIIAGMKEWFDEDQEGFISAAMESGNEWEPYARAWYETEQLLDVSEVGYITKGDYFGYSPDGLVGDGGLIEIKCPQGKELARFMITGEIQPDHIKQMQWGMWVSGRDWCDYVVYNQFDHTGKFVTVYKDSKMHELFDTNAAAFEELMSQHLNQLK